MSQVFNPSAETVTSTLMVLAEAIRRDNAERPQVIQGESHVC